MNIDALALDELPSSLPVLALRRGVLLPSAVAPFAIGRKKSKQAIAHAEGGHVIVAVQRDPVDDPGPGDFLPYAVLARIIDEQGGRNGTIAVLFQGLCRVRIDAFDTTDPYLQASFTPIDEAWPDTTEADALLAAIKEHLEALLADADIDDRLQDVLTRSEGTPDLIDLVASMLDGDEAWRRDILMTSDPMTRGEKVLRETIRIEELKAAREALDNRMRSDTEKLQREALLRRQLKAIQDELGEDDTPDDEVSRLTTRLNEAELPTEVRETVDRELKRLRRIQNTSAERSVALDWLEWIADLPWNHHTCVDPDLARLEAELDASHHGLDDVKRQVVEHIAVKKLGGRGRADVLLLVGPPGVGKTSIGQAIATATERKLVRVALGGVRDEAELRGHRRTYVGARPGRLVEGIRRAGAADPVVLLDEIDKLGRGYHGDPAAALLEILDPEQNHAFVDHYLEVPLDLSRALFVATANDLSAVPGPLKDRMEVIQIAGYTEQDKVAIAEQHLLAKSASNAGMEVSDVALNGDVIPEIIAGWTREAGVRDLQRALGKLYRAAAVKKARGELSAPLEVGVDDLRTHLGRRKFTEDDLELSTMPGIATGLAWTPAGGDVLYVETSTLPGSGKLTLTGQLGDVMKESAQAALTYVLAHGDELGISKEALSDRDVHIHVPAGGVPKDGPSAGVTMFTALASLLSRRPVAGDVAMTGEATLRGRVLPVGGIKSKVLAAHRKGLKRVILPSRNEADLEDLPEQTRAEMEFILVNDMADVLENAFARAEDETAS